MGDDAIIRIQSMTKVITSVAALRLVEAGPLGLDQSLADWLPELADRQVLRRGRGCGGVAGITAFLWHQARRWRAAENSVPSLFPSGPGQISPTPRDRGQAGSTGDYPEGSSD